MRFYYIFLVISFYTFADTDAATSAAEEANVVNKQLAPNTVKGRTEATPFQQYNIQAQCARLAGLAGDPASATDHLNAAKAIKPKEVPESDISYRYGFVDGRLSNEWVHRRGQYTLKQIAHATYKAECPVLM